MNNLFALHIFLLASEGLVAATLLPGLAWTASWCFPKRAALRHLIWQIAFISLVVFPPVTLILPGHIVIEQATGPTPPAFHPIAHQRTGIHSPVVATIGPHVSQSSATKISPTVEFDAGKAAKLLVGLWLVGIAAVLIRHALALIGLSRVHRRSIVHSMPIAELSGPWQLRIATSSNAHGPLTWGTIRPVILLPQNALSWSRDCLVAVLRHEIAHVRCRDALTQTIVQLSCALYWPNPLVWMGARRLRREAEMAADDAVLTTGIKPSSYADVLMTLAAEFRGQKASLAMAAPTALEARVASVLTHTRSRKGVNAMDVLKTACGGVAAIALLALARPELAIAQAETPSSEPIASMTSVSPVAAISPSSARSSQTALVSPNVTRVDRQKPMTMAEVNPVTPQKTADAPSKRSAVPTVDQNEQETVAQNQTSSDDSALKPLANFSRQIGTQHFIVTVNADAIQSASIGEAATLRGNVVMTLPLCSVRSDSATFDHTTGDITLTGNVMVQTYPGTGDKFSNMSMKYDGRTGLLNMGLGSASLTYDMQTGMLKMDLGREINCFPSVPT